MKNTILLLLGTLAIVACHKNENRTGDENPPSDPCTYKSEIMAPEGYAIEEISNIFFYGDFQAFQFINQGLGFMLGRKSDNGYVAVLKSIDGGKNWLDLNLNIPQIPVSMAFKDSNLGIISVNDTTGCPAPNCANKCVILKTTNGGASWSEFEIPNLKGVLHGLQFDEAGKLIAVLKLAENSKIVASDDAGETWQVLFQSPEFGINTKNFQIVQDKIYVAGSPGQILVVDKNGVLSKKIYFTHASSFSFHIIDADNIVYSDFWGLFKSKNGGATWDKISEENGRLIDFPTADKGIQLLYKNSCTMGNIYLADNALAITKDGGASWIEAAVPTTNLGLSFFGSQKLAAGKYRLLFWNKLYALTEK